MGFCGKLSLIALPIIIVAYIILCFVGPKFDSKSIRGKRVLVTGASSGIGEQVAYYYAELGAHLVITARRTSLLEKVAQKCKEIGAQSVYTVTADKSSAADRKKLVQETEEHFQNLDHLILNHAILVKLALCKNTAQNMTFLDQIMDKSKGNLGIVSSRAGKLGMAGISQYCASRHALQGFYATLRQELRMLNSRVSITVIVYGLIVTETAKLMKESAPQEEAGNAREAAIALVEGVSNRAYEVRFPFVVEVGLWPIALLPEWMERYFAGTVRDHLIKD